jgi:outer membrane protein assembly factor BamD
VIRFTPGRATVVAVLALSVALGGCGMMKRKPKVDLAVEERPVELLYSTGARRLDARKWNEAIKYFDEVEREHPYSEWSRRSILMSAFAQYEANNYADAVAASDRFIALYPGNASAAYAYYLKAICYFEQITDVGRDQAATEQALNNLREVVRRFPQSQYATDARLKVDMVQDQLAGKEMSVGRYYLKNGEQLAAISRFKNVIDRYQTTSHTPEALYRLVASYLALGLTDEATRDGAVLGFNYPGDRWYGDAYALLTSKGLKPEILPNSGGKRGILGFGKASATKALPPPEPPGPVAKPSAS